MPLTRGAKVFLGLGALAIATNYYMKRRNIALEAAAHDPQQRRKQGYESYTTPMKGGAQKLPSDESARIAKQQKGAPTVEDESIMEKLSTAGHIAKVHGQNLVEDVTQGAKEIAQGAKEIAHVVTNNVPQETRQPPGRLDNAPLLDSDNNWHSNTAGVAGAMEGVRERIAQKAGGRKNEEWERLARQQHESDMEQLQWQREQLAGRDMLNNQVKRGGLMYEGDIRDVPRTKYDEMDLASQQRKDRYNLREDIDRAADKAGKKVDSIISHDVKPRLEKAKENVESFVRGDSQERELRRSPQTGGSDKYLNRLNEMMDDARSRFENIKSEASDSVSDPKRDVGRSQRSIGQAISRGTEAGKIESQQMGHRRQDRDIPYGDVPYRDATYRDIPYRDASYRDVPYRDASYRDVSYRDVESPRTAYDQRVGPSPTRVESAADLYQQPRGRPSSPGVMEKVKSELQESQGRLPDSREKNVQGYGRDVQSLDRSAMSRDRGSESGLAGKLVDKAADVGIISPETRDSVMQKAENVKDVITSHVYDASKDVQKRKGAIQSGESPADVLASQARDSSTDLSKAWGELKEAVSDENVNVQRDTSSPREPEQLNAAKPFVYKESHRETTPTKFVSPRETKTMK